jgi:hypothetical protein
MFRYYHFYINFQFLHFLTFFYKRTFYFILDGKYTRVQILRGNVRGAILQNFLGVFGANICVKPQYFD